MNNPIFIIGAGRSGTNMLRDALTMLPEFITWPCDEINLTFRHGNLRKKNDIFEKYDLNEKSSRYILQVFDKLQQKKPNSIIIEKTCANSLRIPFLNELFPGSKFILIQRNGYGVTASAKKRWKAPIELKYLLEKLPFVPIIDIPYYFSHFISNRFNQILSADKRQKVWGPIYDGMMQDSQRITLDEVCAKQWASCISKSSHDLSKLNPDRVYKINYDEVLENPFLQIDNLLDWLEVNKSNNSDIINNMTSSIRPTTKKDSKQKFTNEQLQLIEDIIEPLNSKYGL